MSIEDQDAVVGRVVRERSELERKLAALHSEADRIGEILLTVGRKLKTNPKRVFFERQSVPAELALRDIATRPSDVDVNRIITLTDDIRATIARLSQLRDQAANLGIK